LEYRAAVYLVGQGTYREPRFIDIQYLRIERYVQTFHELNPDSYIRIENVYTDINFPRKDRLLDDYPQFKQMIIDIKQGLYNAVLVDIEEGWAFSPYQMSPILNTLDNLNIKVINSYYDSEKIMKEYYIDRFGEGAEDYVYSSDPEDVITFFPEIVSGVIYAVTKGNSNLETVFHELDSYKPYTASQLLPMMSPEKSTQMIALAEKNRQKRKENEPVYIFSTDDTGYLVEESIGKKNVRNEEEWQFAEERLRILGFQRNDINKKISYTRNINDIVIYADPRRKGKITFHFYKMNNKKSRYASMNYEILDAWKNNLEEKLQKALEECI